MESLVFSNLPSLPDFDRVWAANTRVNLGGMLHFKITYLSNNDEESDYADNGLQEVWEFLKDTLKPGEGFHLEIGEVDPTED